MHLVRISHCQIWMREIEKGQQTVCVIFAKGLSITKHSSASIESSRARHRHYLEVSVCA